jgi:hypothetical protein
MRCGLCRGRNPVYFCEGEVMPVDTKEDNNSNIIEEESDEVSV